MLGPVTTAFMIFIWIFAICLGGLGNKDHAKIAFAFLLSWGAARLATGYDDLYVLLTFYPVCAFICLSAKDEIVRLIGMLYGLRILVVMAFSAAATQFWMWEVNLYILTCQIVLALATIGTHSYGRRIRRMAMDLRHSPDRVAGHIQRVVL